MKHKFPNKKHKRRKQLRRDDMRAVKAGLSEILEFERFDYEEWGEYEKEFDWEDYSKETCMTFFDEDEDWYEFS